MALSDIADMTTSASLRARITAAAARQGRDTGWTGLYLTIICATTGWDAAWASGQAGGPNVNPDTGIRTDVISDQMITDAVAQLIAGQASSGTQTA